nr:unnamed protein product [Callosobruchus chinensis]
MRTYKRKSERGKISKGTYDKAGDILEQDETKTIRGVAKDFEPRKIVAPKGAKQVGSITSAERGSLVTPCAAGNAVGNSVPCMFVFPRIKYIEIILFAMDLQAALALATRVAG